MKKKKTNTKFILLMLVLAVLIIYLIHRTKGSKASDAEIEKQISNPGTGSNSTASPSSKKSTKTQLGNDYTLKSGTWGREVSWVQYYYNKMVADPKKLTRLVQDGKYGPKTEAAVKSILGKTTTSWTEWKRTLDAKAINPVGMQVVSSAGIVTPLFPAESTKVVNPYAIKPAL